MENQTEKFTYEMLLQSFQETDKKIKELTANVNGLTAKIDKTTANIDKNAIAIEETNKQIFGISKSNGDMAEDTVYNALEQKMTFANIEFDDIDRNWNRKSKKLKIQGEYDVILKNGDILAIIETKYKVRKDDVTKFATTKLENFRKLFDEYKNYKILLGISGMSFEKDAIEEAKENGVGIIKVVGDKVEYHTEGIKEY